MSYGNPMREGSNSDGRHFLLGFFSPNCDGGNTISTIPDRWVATWDSLRELSVAADEAGLDFMLPISRWRGWGGSSNFHGNGIECLAYVAATAPLTKRINLFATINVASQNPAVVAKQIAAVDQLSQGRAGINIVCGWNPREQGIYGIGQMAHDEQYEYAQEWIDIAQKIWNAEKGQGDYKGRFFECNSLDEVQGPLPYHGSPLLINAAQSATGRAFAERNCDYILHACHDLNNGGAEVSAIKADAKTRFGRDFKLLTTAHIICRPTEAEARDYHQYVLEHIDFEATENLMSAIGLNYNTIMNLGLAADATEAQIRANYEAQRNRFATGHGTYGPILGTPDQVADTICRFSDIGYSGFGFSFINYMKDLPYFRQEVIPRLEARGIRQPVGDI